jgi:phospholipid/cholesterol/gamma-HCH transport system substrate-binding protein
LEFFVGLFVLLALSILGYMSIKIGAIRIDNSRYARYHVIFSDVSGLSKKAQAKIAGVTVGWVQDVKLGSDGTVVITVMIDRSYVLHNDAYALVRQDGLLGSKFLEIIPGDPLKPQLPSESMLSCPIKEQPSIDDILRKIRDIAEHIESVTGSLKACCDNPANVENIFKIGNTVTGISHNIEHKILPAFKESIENVSLVFERDFNRVASRLETSIDSLEETAQYACSSLKNIDSIAEKINAGHGCVGNLINDDRIYHDIQYTTGKAKTFFTYISNLHFVFDSHFEAMCQPAEFYSFADKKGYFDIRIHPNREHFMLIQVATSEKGIVYRYDKKHEFSDRNAAHLIDLQELDLPDWARVKWQYYQEQEKFKRNTLRIGVQVGKIFGNVALRFGLFDGYFGGVAADLHIPFESERFRWLMTFEAYDLHGWNRERDRRPHLKWFNKIYFMHNAYALFGADDFISKRNANIILGAGVRFGQDTIKNFFT